MGGGPVCFPGTTPQLTKNSESKIKMSYGVKKITKNNSDYQLKLGAPDTTGSCKKLGCLLFVSACSVVNRSTLAEAGLFVWLLRARWRHPRQ